MAKKKKELRRPEVRSIKVKLRLASMDSLFSRLIPKVICLVSTRRNEASMKYLRLIRLIASSAAPVPPSKKSMFFAFSIPFTTGFLSSLILMTRKGEDEETKRANEYFPVQSDSERAKGHPIVGSV